MVTDGCSGRGAGDAMVTGIADVSEFPESLAPIITTQAHTGVEFYLCLYPERYGFLITAFESLEDVVISHFRQTDVLCNLTPITQFPFHPKQYVAVLKGS